MKEHPILFTGPMVRALLEGKTQTRRAMNPQPVPMPPDVERMAPFDDSGYWWACKSAGQMVSLFDAPGACPYGYKGDQLWVKETGWYDTRAPQDCVIYAEDPSIHKYQRPATLDNCDPEITTEYLEAHEFWVRRPSIFMRRWMSRITLEIAVVRVERLNDISADAALAEGVSSTEFWKPKELDGRPFEEKWWDDYHFWSNYPQIVYRKLWESINGAGSWELNPWVWVIEFKRITP